MWKEIVTLFKSEGPLQEAYDEAILMLRASHSMFDDAVEQLHSEGVLETDIYKRDRQINRYERSVRRKIVTHMSVSAKPDINLGLVLTSIVIDIERIGDYTKNIVELAAAVPGPFDGLELTSEVNWVEARLAEMFDDIVPMLDDSDVDLARSVIEAHGGVAKKVDKHVAALSAGEVLQGRAGHAVTVAIYLRFLKRVSAHLKNVATSVVNPYYRIGFREKDEAEE
jgi:phosphate transport system protein